MDNSIIQDKKNVKEAAGAPQPVIIQKVEVRPVNRTTQDIPNWRRAVQNAESRIPRRSLLYDLYADVVQDGHVIAVTGKRLDAVTTANWQFVNKAGKPVDTINELIDTIGFDDIVTEIINSKFWGYSILEPKFWKNHSGKWEVAANLLPRLNYRPHLGIVAYDYNTDKGVNIREGIYAKTVMEVGNAKDLGLLVSAAQYAILKRGGVGDYAMFVQVFGRPIIDATWDGFDEKQRIQLKESLDIGPGGVIIRPEGTAITILESKTTNNNIHPDFLKILNKEISKALLGTTETTESSDSSGYAQAQTHGEQDNNKHESDINFVRRVLNSRFIKVLEAHGFNTEGGEFMVQGEETKLTTKESFEMHKSMRKDLGIPIDDEFFYETYDIPKPKNYDQIKKEREAMKQKALETQPNKPDKKEEPEGEEVKLKWLKKMFPFFFNAPAVTTGATHGHHHTINLTLDDTFNGDELIQRVYEAKGKLAFDFELYNYTVKTLLKGFKKGWSKDFIGLQFAPSFEYNYEDPALLTAFEQNIFRFTGAKTLAEMQMLNELFRKANSFEEFYELARKQVQVYNKDWLLTEYNTAVLTGEAAATYHRLMAQVDIFPYWEYKTAGDNHVRPTHQLLEGIILPANDDRWKKLFPPNGWNCRCYIVPRMRHEWDKDQLYKKMKDRADAYLNSAAYKKEELQGWGVNRADIGKIFTANQQYVHKFPGMASKELNTLGAGHFNLPSYSKLKKAATAEAPEFTSTVDAWFKELEIFNDKPVVRDYNKRPLHVEKKNFIRHISKKDDRGKLITAMEQAIKQPDEVWLNGKDLEDLVYIKYYKDYTLITLGDVTKGKLELSTWFILREAKQVITKYRRGLLVFNKK